MVDTTLDRIAIRALSAAFDEFVAACVDEHGKPRAPSAKALAKARGWLPPGSKMAYTAVRANAPETETEQIERERLSVPAVVTPETDPKTPPYAGMYYDFGDGLHRVDRCDDGGLKAVRLEDQSEGEQE